jgi:hypothetical protein
MVQWWQKVIEFLIEKDGRIYITYQDLVEYVNFFNLKPTPLQKILNYLKSKDVLS